MNAAASDAASESTEIPDENAIIERYLPAVEAELQRLYAAKGGDPRRFERSKKIDPPQYSDDDFRAELHDPDFGVFRHFKPDDGLIVDIGANRGMSALSIWASGCASTVLSLEAFALHTPALEAIRRANPERFRYQIAALGNRTGELEFIMPVVNDRGLNGLASAKPHWPSFARNIIRFGALALYQSNRPVDIDLAFFKLPVARLDDVLRSNRPATGIAAIKIDVEGLEPEVVEGARQTLIDFKPLLLIEAASYRKAMRAMLRGLGYRFARREGDRLRPTRRLVKTQNTFLWHIDRWEHYRRAGLMLPHWPTAVRRLLYRAVHGAS